MADGAAARRAARAANRSPRTSKPENWSKLAQAGESSTTGAARALACYPRLVWIAGGIAKSGGIAPLAQFFPRIAHAFLIGHDAPLLSATLAEHGVKHSVSGTLERAVPAAWEAAQDHDAPVVLLSPACASFDQFSGFEARGDRFRALAAIVAEAA